MLQNQSSSRWRVGAVLLIGLMVALVGGAYELATYHAPFFAPPTINPSTPDLPRPPASGQAARPAPSFDVVRIAPDGGAVLAGRAAPGDAVTVTEGGRAIGETKADATGSWVLTPSLKLPTGAGELILSARAPDGRMTAAQAPVLVIVPERPGAAPSPAAPPLPAVAILAPPAAPPPSAQTASGQPGRRALGLATLDYDENGAIRFSGAAPAGLPVRVYVDNTRVGDAITDAEGRWSLSTSAAVAPGLHSLRVDQLTPQGAVASRVETPFQREARVEVAPGQVVVQPGQNLWRLARQVYGNGTRYTVIFLANKDHIRNASLIYPGQVFAVPTQAAPPQR